MINKRLPAYGEPFSGDFVGSTVLARMTWVPKTHVPNPKEEPGFGGTLTLTLLPANGGKTYIYWPIDPYTARRLATDKGSGEFYNEWIKKLSDEARRDKAHPDEALQDEALQDGSHRQPRIVCELARECTHK